MQTGLNSHDMNMEQIINIFQWFYRFVGCMEHDYEKETVHGTYPMDLNTKKIVCMREKKA